MNTSSPLHGDWAEKIPDDETFDNVSRRLSEELQRAATNLVVHLQCTSFRIRIGGGVEHIYITLGGGRHTDEDSIDQINSINGHHEAAVTEESQVETALPRCPAKQVPDRSHANLDLTSNLEKFDLNP